MKLLQGFMISCLCLSSSTLFAAQASDQSIDKLLKIMDMEPILQETVKQTRPQIEQQAYLAVQSIVKREKLSPQEQIIANELADKNYQQSMKSLSWEVIKPLYQQIYKSVFSEEEVKAQINFYSTPTGQSILKKTPQVAQESMKLLNSKLLETISSAENDYKDINQKLESLKNSQPNS